MQNDLFGSNNSHFSIDTSFKTARRFAFDDHSLVEIVPGWMAGASLLYEQMRNSVPWLEHERRMFNKVFLEPRITAVHQNLGEVPEQNLLQAVRVLSSHYGLMYDGLWRTSIVTDRIAPAGTTTIALAGSWNASSLF